MPKKTTKKTTKTTKKPAPKAKAKPVKKVQRKLSVAFTAGLDPIDRLREFAHSNPFKHAFTPATVEALNDTVYIVKNQLQRANDAIDKTTRELRELREKMTKPLLPALSPDAQTFEPVNHIETVNTASAVGGASNVIEVGNKPYPALEVEDAANDLVERTADVDAADVESIIADDNASLADPPAFEGTVDQLEEHLADGADSLTGEV